jgi:hypothetical protein
MPTAPKVVASGAGVNSSDRLRPSLTTEKMRFANRGFPHREVEPRESLDRLRLQERPQVGLFRLEGG